jgi:hypothetical protein
LVVGSNDEQQHGVEKRAKRAIRCWMISIDLDPLLYIEGMVFIPVGNKFRFRNQIGSE